MTLAISYSPDMNIKQYFKSSNSDQQEALAKKAGTTVGYLAQLKYGNRICSRPLAEKLEEASCEELGGKLDAVSIIFLDRKTAYSTNQERSSQRGNTS